MMQSLLKHLAAFAVGAGLTYGALALSGNATSASGVLETLKVRAGTIPAPATSVDDHDSGEGSEETTPLEQARKLFTEALPAIRRADGNERAARVELLLKQLKGDEKARIAVLQEFLASEEDFPVGPLSCLNVSILRGGKTLRTRILGELSLAKVPGIEPAIAREYIRNLGTVTNIEDAADCIYAAEYRDPGKYRAEAIAAIQRLASAEGQPQSGFDSGEIATIAYLYEASELLPILESRVLTNPDALGYYLGALWKFPAEVREEKTTQILSNPTVLEKLKSSVLMGGFDFNVPAAREVALQWFNGSGLSATAKVEMLDQLTGDPRGPSSSRFVMNLTGRARAGAPDNPTQRQARLAFLDEIAPCCHEPLFQQKLATVRESLKKQQAGKK